MEFQKYHGLGNDFLLFELPDPGLIDAARARALCDRRLGVGADGVLVLSPSEHALARMTIMNADGSRPEMCGNGLRCAALHIVDGGMQGVAAGMKTFDVETDAGILHCQIEERASRCWITISLGRAQIQGELSETHADREWRFQRVSIGNPHAVSFDAGLENSEIDDFAPRVSARFPQGVNVEFVSQLGPRELQVVVWERGVGRTLACGTGAGAVVAAAANLGKVPFDESVTVHLPGGELEIRVRQSDLAVELAGPAVHVFSGSL